MSFFDNIIFTTCTLLLQNILLNTYVEDCNFFKYKNKRYSLLKYCLSALSITLIYSFLAFITFNKILIPNSLTHLSLITFALFIIIILQITEIIFKKLSFIFEINPKTFLLIAVNSCMMISFATLLIINNSSFVNVAIFCTITSFIYTFFVLVFSYLLPKIEEVEVPKNIKGLPITLLTVSILLFCLFGLF